MRACVRHARSHLAMRKGVQLSTPPWLRTPVLRVAAPRCPRTPAARDAGENGKGGSVRNRL
jgi:hypothetical protein